MFAECIPPASKLLHCTQQIPADGHAFWPPRTCLSTSLQLLLSACERGAQLDVCVALVKATAQPGVTRDAIYEQLCDDEDAFVCPDCGGWAAAACWGLTIGGALSGCCSACASY